MNVSAWSIRHPVPALMLFVLLSLAGLASFKAMKVQQFMDLDLPTITVTAALPGASPAQLEADVARKLENSLATVQGLKNIYSSVRDGAVVLTAEFRLEKSGQEALDDVRSAVARVRSDLPSDLRDPVITKLNFSGQAVLAYTVSSSSMDPGALSWFVDQTLTRALLGVKGVGAVTRVGGVDREIRITLDPVRMAGLGVSATDVSRALNALQREAPAGLARLGQQEQSIRAIGQVGDAEALARLEIPVSGGRRVVLRDVAQVQDTLAEPRSAALLNGKSVVGFEVSRSLGASEVDVGAGVERALAAMKEAHPDVDLHLAFDFVTPVQEEFDGSMMLLYEGAILAVLVVWLFLRDWRATWISAVALPLSVIPAFLGMQLLGFSLNVITLLALSLVVGILVDDAIVEVENIVRHLRMGKSPFQAAMEAADEIGMAVIATTFTLVAVFLPTAFMSGIAGKFFMQFGWTASLAVMASLLVARALTPMMAAYLLKPWIGDREQAEKQAAWMTVYLRWARWCLKHRALTLTASLLFFIGSLALIPLLPQGFIPPDDNSQTQVYLELPPGSTLEQTRRSAEEARRLLGSLPEVVSVYTTIGGGTAGTDPFIGASTEVRKATLTIQLLPRDQRPRKQQIEARMRSALAALPGARSKVGLGGSGEKYLLVLAGDDAQALSQAAAAVERDLRTLEGVGTIASTAALVRPEVSVLPDLNRAADLGVSTAAIGETLRIATAGDYSQALAKLNLSDRQVPIVVRMGDAMRQDLAALGRLWVPGSKGPVMLAQVATLSLSSGPAVIGRYNRVRNITFEVELSDRPLGEVTAAVQALPSVRQLPAGVRQMVVGDAEVMVELFQSFGLAMLTGVLCIYIVLVLLFRNFLHPITILAALPLSLGGAFVALLLAGKSFSMPSLIGLIMLMGIATKNSILLAEYAIVARREQGVSRFEALIDACQKRARPIIMTTLAMGAGMLPIALGIGNADPSFRSPMAWSVIGGLVTSTLLSLLVIPVVFDYVDDLQDGVKGLWRSKAKH